MAIARVSVLNGHVVGAMVQTANALVALTGVGLLLGFRPTADLLGWLGAAGLLAVFGFAMTWLTVALGLISKTVQPASNLPLSWSFCRSSAVASSPRIRCRPLCAGSPSTSRSPRRSKR
jgi:ABC-2 type transport system permease protein